jgi:hypothetical protein
MGTCVLRRGADGTHPNVHFYGRSRLEPMRTAVDEQQAWQDYADRLRGLEGEEYDRAEQAAWEDLQAALREARGEATTADDPVG